MAEDREKQIPFYIIKSKYGVAQAEREITEIKPPLPHARSNKKIISYNNRKARNFLYFSEKLFSYTLIE